MNYLWLAVATIAEVIATSLLQASNGFTKPVPTVLMVILYVITFYTLSLALRTIPMGIAYGIWAGVGIILIVAIAWLFQGQKLDLPAMIGIALITVGVVVINLFSKSAAH